MFAVQIADVKRSRYFLITILILVWIVSDLWILLFRFLNPKYISTNIKYTYIILKTYQRRCDEKINYQHV